tara:strand:- start:617 stop:1534 length:918 start_codon:yes stop_codon:yes gene_type:complete
VTVDKFTNERAGIISALVAMTLLAGNGYFAKGLLTDSVSITLIRSLVAAICICLFMLFQGKSMRLNSQRDLLIVGGAALLLGVHWICFFNSMQLSTVTLGMVTLFTYPIITIWLEVMIFRKRTSRLDVITSIMVFIGIVVMANDKVSEGQDNLFAIGLGLISAMCFALRNLIQQHYLFVYPAHKTIFYQTAIISLILLAIYGHQFLNTMTFALIKNEAIPWLCLGVFFTALPHSLMALGIHKIGAKRVAIISCLQPAVAALFAYFLLDEIASSTVIVGASIVVLGALIEINMRRTARQGFVPVKE